MPKNNTTFWNDVWSIFGGIVVLGLTVFLVGAILTAIMTLMGSAFWYLVLGFCSILALSVMIRLIIGPNQLTTGKKTTKAPIQ